MELRCSQDNLKQLRGIRASAPVAGYWKRIRAAVTRSIRHRRHIKVLLKDLLECYHAPNYGKSLRGRELPGLSNKNITCTKVCNNIFGYTYPTRNTYV